MKLQPVKNMPGYVRDASTGAVLNTNSEEISMARKRKKNWQLQQEQQNNLIAEVNSLKQDLAEIKDMLKNLKES